MTFIKKVEAAKNLIREYLKKYDKIACACSFGKDSLVLLHLVRSVNPNVKVFSVLADTEFDETTIFKEKIIRGWSLNYEEFVFENMGDREDCCRAPKVEKFKEAVKDLDAWFAGIRQDEGATRTNFEEVEEKDGLVKINPLLHFTEKDIWRYIALYQVPINPLYKEGYRSLSCRFCSAKEEDENESERAGRWKGCKNAAGECGIHTQSLK